MFLVLARFLGRVEIRLLLSVAIIVSLLPFEWASRFDAAFLVLFGLEFSARVLLIFRGEDIYAHGGKTGITPTEAEIQEEGGWRLPSTGTLLLLLFDLLALLSFLPSLLDQGVVGELAETRWLRLFRLSRMVLLLSYWAPLVRDVWTVLLRRERAKQVALMGLVVLVLSFAGAVVIDQLQLPGNQAIDFDGDGQLDSSDDGFWVHLWWAFRQIQDPGNMLSAPQEIAAVTVSLALTVVGLFMVSFLIGLGTDVVHEMMELSRLRPPGLRGHTLVVNINPSTQQLLHELMRYSAKLIPDGGLSLRWISQLARNTQRGLERARYLVVGRHQDPPDFLRRPELARIVYRQGQVDDETFLVRTDVAHAQRVVLLADLEAEDPDAETIQALLTITESLRDADLEAERKASLLWGGAVGLPKRTRLLIAEILDESNVPAARAAISAGSERMRAFVVPSERLIALFIACITRRPGVGRLLEELLTSHGCELYTLFFAMPGLGYQRGARPGLPDEPNAIMAELVRRARSLPSGERIVPVGVLLAGDDGHDDIRVHINPEREFAGVGKDSLDATEGDDGRSDAVDDERGASAQTTAPTGDAVVVSGAGEATEVDGAAASGSLGPTMHADQARCVGFVAIADNFGRVRELAEDLYDRPRDAVPREPAQRSLELPSFERAETTPLCKVLICGFRSGTVSMLEALIKAEPEARILIMVNDERAREAAWDDFDAHTKLIERKLLRGHHGRFRADRASWALSWIHPNVDNERPETAEPHIRLVTGDWSSSRQLTSLPAGFGHVEDMDAVLLVSSEHHGSDARVSKALMKLETLTRAPRIVAEVLDVELARRMRRRAAQDGTNRVRVYSIQELRAFFMFQSVVVPAFDLVHAELMGSWGQSLVQLVPDPEFVGRGTCTFEELANHLSVDDRVLCAVELDDRTGRSGTRTTIHVASGDPNLGDRIDLERLVGAWVIANDR